MKKLILGIGIMVMGVLGACSAGDVQKDSHQEKLKVVTTFYPMYDFTKHIVGDEGEVSLMIPAGTEVHDYEPSAKELKKVQDADVFVYNNENMEVWVPSVSDILAEGDLTVIKATENMVLLPGSEEEHDHSEEDSHEGHSHELDPHVWLAPSLAIKQVEEIRNQLITAYPDKKDVFTKNAVSYLSQLTDLDQSYKQTLEAATQKSFVTQHAAFGYLALEYGLKQVPIAGLSPSEEPSAARLAELKDFVKENDVNYIYFEENATDTIARTLAEEAKVKLLVLNPLEGLSKEQLANGDDYLSVMKENLASLSKSVNSKGNAKLDATKEAEKTVYHGYFEDKQVKDRELADWAGDWQSVYPYLLDQTLDPIFDYKAKQNKDMTAKEYKDYYQTGYATDIKEIKITGTSMTFINDKGESATSDYNYVGYKILDYEKGNRGVRYCFEAVDPKAAYKTVQFSDHTIEPSQSAHFHLYFGNQSQDELVKELDNWPTYYPAGLSGFEIAQEMMAH
ncbi:zinc ABC transporter substrate-binding protein AdcA [uncultured Vagococcus sp.]|uniref:zinc ABC transporter substrate-binding protein AdcA n=1 Tax=uncultured Vagococcus sp. TaxID=189676 RepID=UPI0028D46BB3|nr:zinc ABC transporter substrate-binding protein AdcA [uncultured Vagococcus sp.]